MAFKFNWPEFDTGFYQEARSQLEAALNKGNKPKNIVDYISVTELHMGTTVSREKKTKGGKKSPYFFFFVWLLGT